MSVYLVTGSASGIGRRVAEGVLARGHSLCATDIAEEALGAALPARERTLTRRLDVRDPEGWRAAVDETVARFGRLDVLVNNAGVLMPGWVHEIATAEIERMIDINLKGVIFGTREAARVMLGQGGGHIINVGSLASLAAVPGLSAYAASKFGVRGFSLAAAQELRAEGVAVSVVMPDAVDTPMFELESRHEEAALSFSGQRPLAPEEVAALILGPVVSERPLEATLPRFRGALARLANAVPAVGIALVPSLTRKGLAAQARFRKARG